MHGFPVKPCQILVTQLAKLRSNCSLYFAAPFTLFLWVMVHQDRPLNPSLAAAFVSWCMEKAIWIAQRPHILCYNNINIGTSIFMEQRSSAPAEVQCLGPLLSCTSPRTWIWRTCDLRQCSSVRNRPPALFSMPISVQWSSRCKMYTASCKYMSSTFCCKCARHSKVTTIIVWHHCWRMRSDVGFRKDTTPSSTHFAFPPLTKALYRGISQ